MTTMRKRRTVLVAMLRQLLSPAQPAFIKPCIIVRDVFRSCLNWGSYRAALPAPQPPKNRHQQRYAECGDGDRNEYAARLKIEREQQTAQQWSGDAADPSHAHR